MMEQTWRERVLREHKAELDTWWAQQVTEYADRPEPEPVDIRDEGPRWKAVVEELQRHLAAREQQIERLRRERDDAQATLTKHYGQGWADAVKALGASIDRVRALHSPDRPGDEGSQCTGCLAVDPGGFVPWPCATRLAVDSQLDNDR